MLHKFYPSAADYDNLSRVATVSEPPGEPVDFSGIVVNKPWGYEYLWYESPTVAIWMLHLKPGASTSLHCHVRKRTSLIVLEGEIRCTTLEGTVRVQSLDSVVLEPCVFHSSEASADGAFLMEIETPPLKHDLVRLRDRYARAGTAYEGQSEFSQDLSQYDYLPLRVQSGSGEQQFRSVRFQLRGVTDRNTALLLASEHDLLIPLSNGVSGLDRCKLEVGEAAAVHHIPAEAFPPRFDSVEILFCKVTA